MKCIRALQVAAWLCCFMPLMAWAELPEGLQQGLEQLASTDGFRCNFRQKLTFQEGDEQVFEGTLTVARPGRFRWEYLKPYKQLYISNGDGIWLYEPDLMQAQWLSGLDTVDPVVMRLLNGNVKAEEITLLGTPGEKFTYHIRIGNGQDIWLHLSDGMPAWIESRDALGNRNRMTLTHIMKSTPDESLFHFDVPQGVDVINTAVSAAGGLNE